MRQGMRSVVWKQVDGQRTHLPDPDQCAQVPAEKEAGQEKSKEQTEESKKKNALS